MNTQLKTQPCMARSSQREFLFMPNAETSLIFGLAGITAVTETNGAKVESVAAEKVRLNPRKLRL